MRRLILALAILAVVLAVVLVWSRHGDDAAEPAPSTAAGPARSPSIAHAGGAARPVAAPSGESGEGGQSGERGQSGESQPQPVPVDPATAPSPDTPVSKPAPPQQPFTREETIAKREADLKLLDDTRTRLAADLATAQGAGSAGSVRELEVRIARLAELRQKRAAELDAIRAGGPLPP